MTAMQTPGMQRACQRYLESTPKSRQLSEEARTALSGGVSRAGMPFLLYPVFIDHARDQYVFDVDGRQLLDLSNGHSALPLGHAAPEVIAAMHAQIEKGLGYAIMEPNEVALARLIQQRVPSMERLRFTAAGSEATMFAIRGARAFTGRTLFARMEGSYHGMHDMMGCGPVFNLGQVQPGTDISMGLPRTLREQVIFLPFNDLEGCTKLIESHAHELAAVITEPMLGGGGAIPAEPGFLQGLRDVCTRCGVLLIFDEMITIGLAPGGGQELYGVSPDMTTSGKLLGGGMPMGVFGGRADIMSLFEAKDGPPKVFHTGTWNGHPLAMTAGIAQLKLLTPAHFAKLGELGRHLREGAQAVAARKHVTMQVTGLQQFSCFHYTSKPVRNYRDALTNDFDLAKRVAFSLLSQGFYMAGGRSNLSTATTHQDIERFLEALSVAFDEAA